MSTNDKSTNALSVIDMNFDGNVFSADFISMEKAAKAYAGQFDGLAIVTEDDRKEARRIRGEINSKISEINAARIALYKQYDQPKDAFTAQCNSIIEILKEQVKYVDDGLKRKDEEFLSHRKDLLLEAYEGAAKELMEHIPLNVFTHREPKLLGRTWGDVKACNTLVEMAINAVGDRNMIKSSCQEFHIEADMAYCRSLDLRVALDKHQQFSDQKAQREEHERMMREAALIDGPTPTPTTQPKPVSGYPSPANRKGAPVQAWSFEFLATRPQAESLAEYARGLGIKSDGIKARKNL